MITQNGHPPEVNPLQQYFDTASEQIASLRGLFAEISRAPHERARQKILGDLVVQAQSFKFNSALPGLQPISQLASVLEGLLQQLKDKPSNINLSILRTTAAAVVLLETLSRPGLKPDLATHPPVRLLAVDDDPICRIAVSNALRRVFNEPDLACEGEAALTLAAMNQYDVIFLDIEMPGMDGFELCCRIRETSSNRITPIVFVTSHSDFESKTKSTKSGGQDLIGKPFLSYELALKALTLVLRNRLQPRPQLAAVQSSAMPAPRLTIPATITLSSAASAFPDPLPSEPALSRAVETVPTLARAPSSVPNPPAEIVNVVLEIPARQVEPPSATDAAPVPIGENPTEGFIQALFAQSPARIEAIRDQVQSLSHDLEEARPDRLARILADIQALTSDLERAELRAAARLTVALEALLKKFIENPKHLGPSTLNAATSALSLLEELCTRGLNPDLANPEARILVVDDDPVVRLAMSGAIQNAFAKTDNAQTGEEALAMAGEKPFDLIFLDVEMPGMDGFTACRKIHGTEPNSRTPIVFVTSHSDMDSRGRAALSGCSGFIPKPALPIEITLRTVTFGLKGRLDKLKRAKALAGQ